MVVNTSAALPLLVLFSDVRCYLCLTVNRRRKQMSDNNS